MQTIIIPVSKDRTEDNILDLVRLLEEEFDGIIRLSNALLVETDIPQAIPLLKAIASKNGTVSPGKYDYPVCPDCGASVRKQGNRCKSCANKLSNQLKRKHAPKDAHAYITEIHEGEGNNGVLESA